MNTSCSLEHCHTNLFALQSLTDLRWKCFRAINPYARREPYNDPVLDAFWNAFHNDMLCAWRRVPTDDKQKTERELWIFAVNEDLPFELLNLKPIHDAHGSWGESTMSYDCRSMLFKALHNMIEKYFLSRGFARLNKWFVLPVNNHSDVKVPNLSFNFNFFLHGDSKVCASIDVQRHKDIFHLSSDDLEQSSPIHVILAPYGISGILIGAIPRDADITQLREQWQKNYPLRHLDGLPEFVEVTIGKDHSEKLHMFYPTCYVYKTYPPTSNSKKSDVTARNKSKKSMDFIASSTANQFDRTLMKQVATHLLTNVQRTHCFDTEKKLDSSPLIADPMHSRPCECSSNLLNTSRPSTLVPFHRRARPVTASSVTLDRHPTELLPVDTFRETPTRNRDVLIPSHTSAIPQENSTDWTVASTPTTLQTTTTGHAMTPVLNPNANTSDVSTERGVKRTAAMAFGESLIDGTEDDDNDDDHREGKRQRQIYDFSPMDTFLQSVLKRFALDEQVQGHRESSLTGSSDHVYRHGQPTPPSPTQHLTTNSLADLDEGSNFSPRDNYSAMTRQDLRSISSLYNTDGPSMADLETIIESNDHRLEKKETNNLLDHQIPSPNRKENLLPPPSTGTSVSTSILSVNADATLPSHRLYIGESIYSTPPGSSSSEKLQALHSPYAVATEFNSHAVNPPDTFHQFSHESILVPFDSGNIFEQSLYHSVAKYVPQKSIKRYQPSPSMNNRIHRRTNRQGKGIFSLNEHLLSPLNSHQMVHRHPRSVGTPSMISPARSTDLASSASPYHVRSVSSVQTVNSPMTTTTAATTNSTDIDSCLLNLLLNDSILNHFRDINFDSCALCACKPNELSIHGQDAIIYLEKAFPSITNNNKSISPPSQAFSTMNNNCSCGFSAVVNLRLSLGSGLFYEDEMEITGTRTDVKYRSTNDPLPVQLLELIERRETLSSPFDCFNPLNASRPNSKTTNEQEKPRFYRYENRICRAAIEQARTNHANTLTEEISRYSWLDQWSYTTTSLDSNQQSVLMLRSLQPLLIEALTKRTNNSSWNTIDGPLTWKSFHQLLHVQNQHAHLEEQISGPQPIPYVLAGLDREWIMLAPHGLKYWDKLCLEPYSKRKEIVYLTVVPDNDYICSMTKIYLRELSTSYELCRLGLHKPWTKLFPDQGLLRIPEQQDDTSSLPNVDPWFTDHQTSHPLGHRLKLYAQILKDKLASVLFNQSLDVNLFDDGNSRRDMFRLSNDSLDYHSTTTAGNDFLTNNSTPSPASSSLTTFNNSNHPISNNLHATTSNGIDSLNNSSMILSSSGNGTFVNGQQVDPQDLQPYEAFHHGKTLNDDQIFLVIYIIDTFRYELMGMNNEHSSLDESNDIYVKKSIYRAYLDLIKDLPEKTSIRIHIQLIPFESVAQQQLEADVDLRVTHFKRLAFHIYDQLKRTVAHVTRAKSLTSLGPAALEEKAPSKLVMQLYTPAYILAPKSDFRYKPLTDVTEQANLNGSILFCSYCLSDDQRYLLVSCSDERGELLETCSINIEIPDRNQRKFPRAARVGLQKMWDFILRLVTSTTMPWRIVIGRLGRLGHGELKTWGLILSKKNLVRSASHVRETCPMCHILRSHDHPVILSACLISMETQPLLSIFSESFELGEMRGTQASNNNTINLPNNGQIFNDISVTHILTFPTSASVQHLQAMLRPNDPRQLSNDDEADIFGEFINNGLMIDDENMPSPPAPLDSEVDVNDIPTLQQQPLALGLYVSTIGTLNPLPPWMLTDGQAPSNRSSSVFKAVLHINVPNAQHSAEILLAQNNDQKLTHPLDSNYTYIVLRHVLESYHRLSWLLIDTKNNERASCLPIHLERLLRLYQAFMKFV